MNVIYCLFHIYMASKIEFKSRLLNICYSHYAYTLQWGSFLVFTMVLQERNIVLLNSRLWDFIIEIRNIQLTTMSFYNIIIPILHNIHNYNGNLYLELSDNYANSPCFCLFPIMSCISILYNVALGQVGKV